MNSRIALAALAMFVLASCQEAEVKTMPSAMTMTEEALGYYCQMNLSEHEGPKAQIHLIKSEHPIWFSQVRDAVAFTRLPEETDEVSAVYVSDMGKAPSWAKPGDDNWINAAQAWFVIDSRSRGGMGAPEAVPFAEEADAKAFAAEYGGHIARLSDIPDAYVLGPVEVAPELAKQHNSHGNAADGHREHATQ